MQRVAQSMIGITVVQYSSQTKRQAHTPLLSGKGKREDHTLVDTYATRNNFENNATAPDNQKSRRLMYMDG